MKLQYDKSIKEMIEHVPETNIPKDLKEYWDKQLKTIEKTELNYTLKKLDFPDDRVEVFLLSFISLNNDTIYGYYARPVNDSTDTVDLVLQYHGYNWAMDGDLMSVVDAAHKGNHSYKMLVRGQQMSEDSTPTFGSPVGFLTKGIEAKENYYYRYVYLDLVLSIKVLDNILNAYSNVRYIATGGSQGGALALVAAALSPIKIDAVIATHPFLSDFRRSVRITPEGPYHEISEYLKRNSHVDREEIFNNLDYFDVTSLSTLIECPVLLGIGLVDDIVAPSTTFGVYNVINGKKYIEVYPEFAHEVIPDFDLKAVGFVYKIFKDNEYDWRTHPLNKI